MHLLFALFLFLAWSIFFLMHFVVYKRAVKTYGVSLPYWPFVLGLLSGLYFFASFAVKFSNNTLASTFYMISALWVGVLFLTFFHVLVYEFIRFVTGFESKKFFSALLVSALFFSFYAVHNGKEIVTREYTVPVEGLSAPVRIAHLSDIHIGTVHRTDFLRRIVEKTNAQKPDVVVITGDLFDGSAPIHSAMLSTLQDLSAPSFFSHGNHEFYEGLENVRYALSETPLILLENEAVEYFGVQIIGANDAKSIPRDTSLGEMLDSLKTTTMTPRVLMYHTPVEWEEARAHGVDLMLSGHTHNGQIFPFTLIVRVVFQYINGLYESDGKYLHVSPGTGTWGPPMRLGSNNQITVLSLTPSQE